MFKEQNQKDVIRFALDSDDSFRILSKDIEFPLYSDNNYLLAIVDCLLEIGYRGEKHYILCEFKPKLNSISAAMGQIRIYREILARTKLQLPSWKAVKSVIITYDIDERYDLLLESEDIKVFRLGHNIVP